MATFQYNGRSSRNTNVGRGIKYMPTMDAKVLTAPTFSFGKGMTSDDSTFNTLSMELHSTSTSPTDNWPIDPSLLLLPNSNASHQAGETAQADEETTMDEELEELNQLSYEIRDRIQKECLSDTTTYKHYENYVKQYTTWWHYEQHNATQAGMNRGKIPAFPITPAKVVMFLDHTMKRPKRTAGGRDILGTNVGKATIQSTINALEWERGRNAHKYPDNKDAQINLRSDNRIKNIERSAKHNEPQRILFAQTLKASGSSAGMGQYCFYFVQLTKLTFLDTYTQEEMIEISLSCLRSHRTLASFSTAVRDRALYLVPVCTAFRGDNIRELALSDLFSKPIINVEGGIDRKIMCLRILCNNAKHNQSGKTEEQGAIRHRLPELCSIGALALHFFIMFEQSTSTYNWKPDFSVEAQSEGYGQHGRREWWEYKVFPGGLDNVRAMTYKNHNKRIHHLHQMTGAKLSKVTHAQRYSAAFVMRSYGTAKEETRAVGWSTADSYNSVYDRELPIEALLGAAMYNARKPETHFCARELLEPPLEITSKIFPWVEQELQALQDRTDSNPRAHDLSLKKFLHLLIEMRRILVQDLAVLYDRIPDSFIYTRSPFDSLLFRQFAVNAVARLKESEDAAQLALQNLPRTVAQTFEGALQQSISRQRYAEEEQKRILQAVVEQGLAQIKGFVEYTFQTAGEPRKRRKLNPPSQPIRSMFTAPPIPSILQRREEFVDEESDLACRNMPGTVALISRPPSAMPPLSELPLAAGLHSHSVAMSHSGQFPATAQFAILPQLGISSQQVPPDTWADNWKDLLQIYNPNQLAKHVWDWEGTQLVPHYNLQPIKSFEDAWKEYVEGLNGFLPLRVLRERWGNSDPAWHRNEGATKTPSSRRKKVTDFIQRLSCRPHWTAQRALNFLKTHCANMTVDKLSRELKGECLRKLMAAVELESSPNS